MLKDLGLSGIAEAEANRFGTSRSSAWAPGLGASADATIE
jgi:hypothetical protein